MCMRARRATRYFPPIDADAMARSGARASIPPGPQDEAAFSYVTYVAGLRPDEAGNSSRASTLRCVGGVRCKARTAPI